MLSTDSTARPSTTDRSRPASWRAAIATIPVPVAAAVGVVVVMGSAASPSEGLADVMVSAAFYGWNLLPMAGAALLLLWAGRRGWLSYLAAALGNLAVAVATALSLHDFTTSDSSTSALIFVTLPVLLWTVVGVAVGLVALTRVRSQR